MNLTNEQLAAIEERAKAFALAVNDAIDTLAMVAKASDETLLIKATTRASEKLFSTFEAWKKDTDVPALVDAIRREREANERMYKAIKLVLYNGYGINAQTARILSDAIAADALKGAENAE